MVLNIALQFHPDWPYEGQMVIEGMAETGQYRSQFQTGISNGGMTALTGDRCRWESRLFGGRYDRSPNHERPVYGAVDLGDPRGPAPRFGSAFVRLRPEVEERATFCYPDSAFEPDRISHGSDVASLVARMRKASADALDRYVEAHVHGGVVFERDAASIVLDPCFRGTRVEEVANQLGCTVDFHDGFSLRTADADAGYRGVAAAILAQGLGPRLTPDVIGAAARSGKYDRQLLKYVWHLMARCAQTRGRGGRCR